jgi:hypothetical protein
MKARWAGVAADGDGCGMRTSVRDALARGIVPQPKAVGKRIEKERVSDAAREARKKNAPSSPGVFQICKLERGNWLS